MADSLGEALNSLFVGFATDGATEHGATTVAERLPARAAGLG